MKKKKLTYLIVGLALIIAIILIYIFGIRTGKLIPRADVDVATMALEPASGNYLVDQIFDVNIVVNTGGIDTDTATAVLNFDSNYLDVVDMDSGRAGTQISPGTIYPNVTTNSVSGNKIVFEATIDLLNDPLVPFNGTGTLATIKFRAKQSGMTTVIFNYVEDSRDMDNSQIIAHNSDTILAQPNNATYTVSIPPLQPTADIQANSSDGPIAIDAGSSATLSWASTNANSCSASGDWSGDKPTTGQEDTGNLSSPRTYIITCTGDGGSASDSVVVNINYPNAPTVDLRANGSDGSLTINNNESATLSWTSSDADSCTASGDWSGAKSTSGSESTGSLGSAKNYILECSGAGGSARDSVTVNVQTSTGGTGETGGTGGTGGTGSTSKTTTTAPTTTTPKPPATSITKLPSNIQPQPTPNKTNVEVKNIAFKTWALWFLYAIIPAVLAGGAIYLYLRRKKQNKKDEVI